VAWVLNSQLKWRLSVEHHDVALGQARVKIVNRCEVKVVEHRSRLVQGGSVGVCAQMGARCLHLVVLLETLATHALSIVHHHFF